jgi:mannose-1-phosphate guanylyltransferase
MRGDSLRAVKGVILGAGLGTRLRPLTDRVPKPALPVVHRPLASYAVERLRAAGVDRIAMNVHHLAGVLERALGDEVVIAREPALLGTGGGVRFAAGALEPDDVFVMNGDILFWPDLEGALALHRALGAIATVVLREDPRARELGALGIDAEGRVRSLLTPAPPGIREHMFTGVHVLSARAVSDLPAEGCIIRKAYRRWIDAGEVVAGFVDHGPWRDLGTPREYLRANLDLASGRFAWPTKVAPIDDGDCVIGTGVTIADGVHLERCVVWAGTHVDRDAREAILAGDLRIETC